MTHSEIYRAVSPPVERGGRERSEREGVKSKPAALRCRNLFTPHRAPLGVTLPLQGKVKARRTISLLHELIGEQFKDIGICGERRSWVTKILAFGVKLTDTNRLIWGWWKQLERFVLPICFPE